jgi:hypothetical protein
MSEDTIIANQSSAPVEEDFIMKVKSDVETMMDSVNLSTCTDKELQDLYDECNRAMRYYEGMQRTVKDCANSVYGACGSPWFRFCNYNVAEDITNEGKLFLFMIDESINKYFTVWANDEDIIKKLKARFGESHISIKNNAYGVNVVHKVTGTDLCSYGDTDSRYIDYGIIFECAGFKPTNAKDAVDFILMMHEERISKIMDFNTKKYVDERHGTFVYILFGDISHFPDNESNCLIIAPSSDSPVFGCSYIANAFSAQGIALDLSMSKYMKLDALKNSIELAASIKNPPLPAAGSHMTSVGDGLCISIMNFLINNGEKY